MYLLLGLLMMMVVLSTLYDIPELNLGFHFYLKNDNPNEEEAALKGDDSSSETGFKYRKQADDAESQSKLAASPATTYQSFQDKSGGGEE